MAGLDPAIQSLKYLVFFWMAASRAAMTTELAETPGNQVPG
jgi:hypothetical protein